MRVDVFNEVQRYLVMDMKPNYSELARRYNCDPRTVKRFVDGGTIIRKKVMKKSILDDYKEIIIEKVDNYGCSAKAVADFIKTKGYSGSYELVKKFVSEHKKESIRKATIRFETTPGLQGQVDWKENYKLVSKNGEVFDVNIFLYVLGYSRGKFIKLTTDRKQNTLFKCMKEAFEYFNGIPEEILFDNMSTVVDRHDTTFGHVKYNNKFYQFSKDSGFKPIACQPYRPQTKGKVEALAKLVERLSVYNNEFETFEELETIVKEFNERLNNEVSRATNESPNQRIKKEQKYLLPIPEVIKDLNCDKPRQAKVTKESMITYKGNKYSVPVHLIGKRVELKLLNNEVQIYYNSEFITSHKLLNNFLNYHESHIKEILKSDAFKYKSDEDIDSFAQMYLKQLELL